MDVDTRVPAGPVLAPASTLLRAALDAAGEAVLLCTAADHTVVLLNAAAAALLPGLRPGGTTLHGPPAGLARATAEGATIFTDAYRGRQLIGRRRPLGDEHYGWYVQDTTDELARAEAFQADRARTTFLAEAGRRLSASLNQRRCVRTTVELAAAHLA